MEKRMGWHCFSLPDESVCEIKSRVKSTHYAGAIALLSMGELHPLKPVKKSAEISGRNIIGMRLRQIRLAKHPKVSLEDLAGRMAARGVTLDRSAIGRIENGNRYVLDYELKTLADALRSSVADFFKPSRTSK